MGWVSFLEDLRDSLAKELYEFDLLEEQAISPQDIDDRRLRLLAIHGTCRRFLDEINSAWEVLSDPRVNLAHDLSELQQANEELKTKLFQLNRKVEGLLQINEQLQQRFTDEQLANARLRYELNQRDQAADQVRRDSEVQELRADKQRLLSRVRMLEKQLARQSKENEALSYKLWKEKSKASASQNAGRKIP